jgi:hypothetical protein
VVQPLSNSGPLAGTQIEVVNFRQANGWQGPGRYLLLLTPAEPRSTDAPSAVPLFRLVFPPRSPGYEASGAPRLYPWTTSIQRQWQQLADSTQTP